MPKQNDVPAEFSPGWIQSLDGRTAIAREMRRRFDEVASDLGGAESLSYLQRSLVSRYLWAEFWIQRQEQAMAEGNDVDMGRYTQAVNSASGLANKLGLDRVARDVPTVRELVSGGGGQ
ncbi:MULTISPECIES: hypothetical protein [Halomonas]|uniref:Phasin domain-containing protein n=1 Tax=Halomonas halophila TaxID=29573 RepID=A0ABQ0U3B2_9GAMM|nr:MULTISPECIES: hypothetical protein [Halomonas]MDR5890292.1 hypothetical protein [Halomonas salina]WJY05790.1 hypothetical protein QWG60_08650 [Halomonas halophila]GEK72948.1 hypothetical protein HHA04nite_14920 [Halomonas halophila]